MKTEPYTGTVAGMKTNPWLASEDLFGLPSPELTITGVFRNLDVKMEAGRKVAELYSISFDGTPKQMILNATNRRELSRAFGASVKNWVGKTVTLLVKNDVEFAGKIVSGLRIKAKGTVAAAVVPTGRTKEGQP